MPEWLMLLKDISKYYVSIKINKMNYTWSIKCIGMRDYGEFKNVVVNVNWQKKGTNDVGKMGYYGDTSELKIPEVFNSDVFIKYENLTEELLITWAKSIITNEDYSNKLILDQIENQMNPLTYAMNDNLPWR